MAKPRSTPKSTSPKPPASKPAAPKTTTVPKEVAYAPPAVASVYPESTLSQWNAKGRPVPDDKPVTLVREALLLNDNAYEVVRNQNSPVRKGLIILGLIVLAVVLARLIGLGLGYLTTPRWDLLSADILSRLTSMRWYDLVVSRNPEFAPQFEAGYAAFWQIFRLFGGYPSIPGTVASISSFALSTFLGWLTFGTVTHWVARWFGGTATLRQFLGALALSYAPLLLYVLEVIPGFRMPVTLVALSLLITRFMAVKRTYRLTPGYSLMTLLLPYIILAFLGVAILSLAAAFGLNQIPFINEIIRASQIWAGRSN